MGLLTMTPAIRYTLLQVPGILFLGGLLWVAWGRGWISLETTAVLMLVWVTKDVLLYPLYRPALGGPAPTGGHALIGRQAVVRQTLQPQGQVNIDGEVWQARCDGDDAIQAGEAVEIVAADGLHLTVARPRNR